MASKKKKKPEEFASPITGDFVRDPSELERAQEKYRHELEGVPVFDGCTDAPYQKQPADTDIQQRVQEEIDTLYPRARLGSDGILDGILRELVRARLSR